METKIQGVYAIGDCIKTPWLAHTASAESLIAVSHILNYKFIKTMNYNCIPMCIYTIPEIAWCGIQSECSSISKEFVSIYKFFLPNNPKFSFMINENGFIKIVIDKETNEILGIHIFGQYSTELISNPSFAVQQRKSVDEIISSIHAHPTLYESIYEISLETKKKG
jgi:dihydrolipoamide dehydrogenase